MAGRTRPTARRCRRHGVLTEATVTLPGGARPPRPHCGGSRCRRAYRKSRSRRYSLATSSSPADSSTRSAPPGGVLRPAGRGPRPRARGGGRRGGWPCPRSRSYRPGLVSSGAEIARRIRAAGCRLEAEFRAASRWASTDRRDDLDRGPKLLSPAGPGSLPPGPSRSCCTASTARKLAGARQHLDHGAIRRRRGDHVAVERHQRMVVDVEAGSGRRRCQLGRHLTDPLELLDDAQLAHP